MSGLRHRRWSWCGGRQTCEGRFAPAAACIGAWLFLAGGLLAQRNWFPRLATLQRSAHVMAYDAARERVVLFGGTLVHALLGDTWEWDGVSWIPRNPMNSP